jgi:DNA processing protein
MPEFDDTCVAPPQEGGPATGPMRPVDTCAEADDAWRRHELLCRIGLALGAKLSCIEAADAVRRFGSVSAAMGVAHSELEDFKRGLSQKLSICGARVRNGDAERELEECERAGVRLVMLGDSEYPELLSRIHDPPLLLYVRGKFTDVEDLSIAIVGSRNADYYGAKTAHTLATELAQRGVCVASGLARGIDTAAHRGALEAGGRTVAVVGSGLVDLYPPENRRLADEIAESGAVVSEFPLKTPGIPRNFPQRNRIISGLSLGVVVAQGSVRSGSLITARLAVEQNREVFAVPGKVDSEDHRGCHHLIREGATLIECADHIFEQIDALQVLSEAYKNQEALNPPALLFDPMAANKEESHATVGDAVPSGAPKAKSRRTSPAKKARKPAALGKTPLEVAILKSLKPSDGINIEELVAKLSATTGEVASTLMALEMRGLIRQLPGRYYVLG